MQKITLVTNKGEAQYPHLRRTECFQGQDTGKYSIQVKFSKEDTERLIERLEGEWKQAQNAGEFATKRYARNSNPNLGYREDKNGDIVFKFKTNATIKTKTGDVMQKTIPIYDAQCKPMEGDIGAGSIVKVSAVIAPYYVSASNYGLSLYLTGVQCIEYKAAGDYNSADALGFTAEEGYTADAPAEDNTTGFGVEGSAPEF